MCVCVCVCVCRYVYVCVCTCICMHACVHEHCMHVCVHAYVPYFVSLFVICVCVCVCAHAHVPSFVSLMTSLCECVCVCVCVHAPYFVYSMTSCAVQTLRELWLGDSSVLCAAAWMTQLLTWASVYSHFRNYIYAWLGSIDHTLVIWVKPIH